MKIEVQYINVNKDGVKSLGRKCWINKNEDGDLTFGTIYTTEKTASNLTKDDHDYLQEKEKIGLYKIINIVGE